MRVIADNFYHPKFIIYIYIRYITYCFKHVLFLIQTQFFDCYRFWKISHSQTSMADFRCFCYSGICSKNICIMSLSLCTYIFDFFDAFFSYTYKCFLYDLFWLLLFLRFPLYQFFFFCCYLWVSVLFNDLHVILKRTFFIIWSVSYSCNPLK